MHVQEMIRSHPDARGSELDALLRCIEQCYSCAQTCVSCADACLAEEAAVRLKQCMRLCLDCADICAVTGAMASRRTGSNEEVLSAVIGACETACRVCAQECETHGKHHAHCRICGEACRRCEKACKEAAKVIH